MENIILNGQVVEVAKPRKGTRCKCCGKELNEYTRFIASRTKSCNVAYVCEDCYTPVQYHHHKSTEDIIKGKLTSGKYRVAIELEANYKPRTNSYSVNAYLAAQWGLVPTNDCTVDVEYHMRNAVSFHGMKDFLDDVANTVDLTTPNAGQHINISKIDWTIGDMDEIDANSQALFTPLVRAMRSDSEALESVFGRVFDDEYYRYTETGFCHGDWLRIKTYCLEFRIAKYQNTKQFFACMNLCRDIVDILDKWLKDEFSVDEAATKIVQRYKLYADGKAPCFYTYRNNRGVVRK